MNEKLHPWYITGIVEGEGSFCVSFSKRRRLKVGIETRPSFSITLNRRDLELLKAIHRYFRCGGIRFSRSDRTYKYEVRSVKDLVKRIIPHFERYPLKGAKAEDFERFAKICKMVHANLHLNKQHLKEIIDLAYGMDPSGKRKCSRKDLLRVLGEVKV
ncbi:endonuclease [bacterium]|nr:MAG: endonuclease [bacterium]